MPPPGGMYPRGHHLRMNEIEVVGWECEPVRSVLALLLSNSGWQVPTSGLNHLLAGRGSPAFLPVASMDLYQLL